MAWVFVVLTASAYGRPPKTSHAELDALAAAIRHLQRTFGPRYPRAAEFLDRLADARRSADRAALAALRREALLANPLVSGRPILFVARPQYANEHGTEATMYQTGQVNTRRFRGGAAIRVLDAGSGKVTSLLNVPQGIARDPDVRAGRFDTTWLERWLEHHGGKLGQEVAD